MTTPEYAFYLDRSGLTPSASLAEAQIAYWAGKLGVTAAGRTWDELAAAFYRAETGVEDVPRAMLVYFRDAMGMPDGLALGDYMAAFFDNPPPDVVPPTSIITTAVPQPMSPPGTVEVTLTTDTPIPVGWPTSIDVSVQNESTGAFYGDTITPDGVSLSYTRTFDSADWTSPTPPITLVRASSSTRAPDFSTALDSPTITLYP